MIIKGNATNREVTIDGKVLSPQRSQKVHNHSPDGFMWGYGGSGPAQLALAIMLEITDQETAIAKYQNFKWEKLATLPKDENFEIVINPEDWNK